MGFNYLAVASAMVVSAPALAQQAPDLAHYVVGATVSPAHQSIAVDVVMLLPPVRAGEQVEFVLGRAYSVQSVDAGQNGTIETGPTEKPWGGLQRIAVTFAQPERSPRIRLRYAGKLNPSGDPPLNMVTPDLTELNLDSAWLPFRSDLGMRFTLDARIAGIAPDAVFVSQGTINRQDSEVRVRRSIPEVDFAFAAATMERVASADFELYAPDPDSGPAKLFLKHGSAAVPFLEHWLGDMPGGAARLVLVRRPRGSGYARKGYIVFSEGRGGAEVGLAKFTAHEFGHLWLSNANAATADRWLDESTAEYVALRYVEHALGREALENLLAPKRERAKAAKPVWGDARTNAELYDKGPLLLFDLEAKIGRERMDRLIAAVAMRKIGRTADFLAVLAELTDPATAAEFERRLKS